MTEQQVKKDSKTKTNKDNIIYETKVFDIDQNVLWEQTKKNLFVTLKDGEPVYEEQIELNGYIYKPMFLKKTFGDININLPLEPVEYGTTANLLEDITTHLGKYTITSKWFLDISGRYVMITWVTEKLNTISYLKAFGDYNSGKTRWLKTTGDLCYKRMTFGAGTTPANIYRMLEKIHDATIAFDEFSGEQNTDVDSFIAQVLNAGFQRGNPVPRCDEGQPHFYDTFGPKLVSTRVKSFNDIALNSRFIDEEFRENPNSVIELPQYYEKEVEELKGKLLLFKLRNWTKIDRTIINTMDLKVSTRVKQVISPYIAVFADDSKAQELIKKYALEHSNRVISHASETTAGGIVKALWFFKKTKPLRTVTRKNGETLTVINVTMDDVKKVMEEMGLIDYNVTAQQLGYIRSNYLNIQTFSTTIDMIPKQVIVWDDEKMEALKKRYLPEDDEKDLDKPEPKPFSQPEEFDINLDAEKIK